MCAEKVEMGVVGGSGGFTPGPWQSGIDDLEGVVSGGPLAAVGDGNVICLPPEGMEASLARWHANARLIAAAPDLLTALQNLAASARGAIAGLADLDARSETLERVEAEARNAIDKALGQ